MERTQLLMHRLDDIGRTLEVKGGALALLGLGSVGIETGRLDEYSDLDFFVIVAPGYTQRFIEQLDWLEDTYPLAYHFRNSDLGHKILFEDGIYGEFAVFEEAELAVSDYSEGRIVWMAPGYFNRTITKPLKVFPRIRAESVEFSLNEALTNQYVGLCRYARGEKLSALKFIERYAVDSIISVLHLLEEEVNYYPDIYGNERRFEKRFPDFAARLGTMLQGYNRVPQSAVSILGYLEEMYPVNPRLSAEIRRLAMHCGLS
ncbi:hypothetical protein [Paenibacillus sp. sgz500958]|uniref:hypothetical protein n=1 Tax=Paenibacillus sp. sgz500958 TaxID=3242475 RepID=UPI0036D33B36